MLTRLRVDQFRLKILLGLMISLRKIIILLYGKKKSTLLLLEPLSPIPQDLAKSQYPICLLVRLR